MAPECQLCSIPTELLRTINSLLPTPAQAVLGRTCKELNTVLTPLIWRHVELHSRGTHEGLNLEKDADDGDDDGDRDDVLYPYKDIVHQPSGRAYAQPATVAEDPAGHSHALRSRQGNCQSRGGRATDNRKRRSYQVGREEIFTTTRRRTTAARWDVLAGHVRTLCMSVGVDAEVMEVVASLRNLTSLELVGLPLTAAHPTAAPAMPLAGLRSVRLRGFFPAAFVGAVCGDGRNARPLTHLDLGLLATPADDADEEALEASADPRALHSPLWLPPALPGRLVALTHLHLVRPHLGRTGNWMHDQFVDVPAPYERAVCAQWVGLLRGVAGTLRDLVLEHRVPVRAWGGDAVAGYVPAQKRSRIPHRRWASSRGRPDAGDELFCATVLAFLLGEKPGGAFAHLRHLALRGIQIRGVATTTAAAGGLVHAPGGHGELDNDALLRLAFPQCAVELYGEAAYPIYVYQDERTGCLEAVQDEGDGLLYNAHYFTDYRKRFGRQWRIGDGK